MVDNAYRGHGIGEALMKACLSETDRLGVRWVVVVSFRFFFAVLYIDTHARTHICIHFIGNPLDNLKEQHRFLTKLATF